MKGENKNFKFIFCLRLGLGREGLNWPFGEKK